LANYFSLPVFGLLAASGSVALCLRVSFKPHSLRSPPPAPLFRFEFSELTLKGDKDLNALANLKKAIKRHNKGAS
jgi:hypothetical protein